MNRFVRRHTNTGLLVAALVIASVALAGPLDAAEVSSPSEAEIVDLRERVAALEQQVERLSQARPSTKARTARAVQEAQDDLAWYLELRERMAHHGN